jgi:3',5'-cyclic AMP phosphodiesterase CpdA
MLIAQLSDPHVKKSDTDKILGCDQNANLESAISELNAMKPRPDVVLLTGDLTNSGEMAETEVLRKILDGLEIQFYLIPGNHDDLAALRAVLGHQIAANAEGGFMHQVVDSHSVRLIGLDTTMAGYVSGELCEKRIAWLDARLGDARDKPTALFMHHPPFQTGIWWLDCVGLLQGCKALGKLLKKHRQVKAIFCGHVHRAIQSTLSDVPVFTSPSTGIASKLDLQHEAPPIMVAEPPAILLHYWTGSSFVTHTHYVGRNDSELEFIPLMPNWPSRLELMRDRRPIPKKLGTD